MGLVRPSRLANAPRTADPRTTDAYSRYAPRSLSRGRSLRGLGLIDAPTSNLGGTVPDPDAMPSIDPVNHMPQTPESTEPAIQFGRAASGQQPRDRGGGGGGVGIRKSDDDTTKPSWMGWIMDHHRIAHSVQAARTPNVAWPDPRHPSPHNPRYTGDRSRLACAAGRDGRAWASCECNRANGGNGCGSSEGAIPPHTRTHASETAGTSGAQQAAPVADSGPGPLEGW